MKGAGGVFAIASTAYNYSLYKNGEISTGMLIAELAVTGLSFIPVYGLAVAIAWELGKMGYNAIFD